MSGTEQTTLGWLRDLALLRALAQRYSRSIDQRDYDAVAQLFTDDAVIDGARGRSSVTDWLAGLRAGPRVYATSMHVLGDPLVQLEPGCDDAQLDTYATVYQLRGAGSVDGDLELGIRYLDDAVRDGDQWRIRNRQSVTLWTRTVPSR